MAIIFLKNKNLKIFQLKYKFMFIKIKLNFLNNQIYNND